MTGGRIEWAGMDLITPLGQSGDQIRNVKKLTRPAPNPVPQNEPWAAERRGKRRAAVVVQCMLIRRQSRWT